MYPLGVILYEMLAGRRPYKLSRQLHEPVRTIREEDPAPLSSVSRDYWGDIETIVAQALEKDKGPRYGSAAALATVIERYLADQPISSRPARTITKLPAGRSSRARAARNASQSFTACRSKAARTAPVARIGMKWSGIVSGTALSHIAA